MQLNGAQILINALEAQGVDTIFGYPGGAVLEIYDALKSGGEPRRAAPRHKNIRHACSTSLPAPARAPFFLL